MKSLKLMLLTGAIIISNQITAMHTEAITGKGVTATAATDKKTSGAWTRAGGSKRAPGSNLTPDLPTVLSTQDKDKKQSGSSSSDSSASPKTTGIAAPTSLTVIIPAAAEAPKPTLTGSPKTTATHCVSPKAPAAPVVVLASPRDLFADAEIVTGRKSPSPVRCGAGCGAGSGPSASDDGYDSDKEIIYTGRQPEISTQKGSYKPGNGLLGYFFPQALADLNDGKKVDVRRIEKASAETSVGVFAPEDVALFAKLAAAKHPEMGLPFWGDLNRTCKINKEQQAALGLQQLREIREQIVLSKEGEKAALDAYGNVNGSGRTSPLADYGISRKYKGNELEATLQLVRKLFALEALHKSHSEATGK